MTRNRKKIKQTITNKKNFLIIGIILVSMLIILYKNTSRQSAEDVMDSPIEAPTLVPVSVTREPSTAETLEESFDRLILTREPVFAFFHSNNCKLCIDMIGIVKEVFPEYAGKVSLVDINVYDEQNRNLLIKANIHSIPTQIFINKNGEVFQSIGVMSLDQLRAALDKISGNQ